MRAMVSPMAVVCCFALDRSISNFHLDLLRPEPFWLDTARSTRSVSRPRYDISYPVMQAKAAESRDARSIVTAFAWTARSSSMYFFASKNRGFPITAASTTCHRFP